MAHHLVQVHDQTQFYDTFHPRPRIFAPGRRSVRHEVPLTRAVTHYPVQVINIVGPGNSRAARKATHRVPRRIKLLCASMSSRKRSSLPPRRWAPPAHEAAGGHGHSAHQQLYLPLIQPALSVALDIRLCECDAAFNDAFNDVDHMQSRLQAHNPLPPAS